MTALHSDSESLNELKREVLVHVGVSLAHYQKIERGLKILLPFFYGDDRDLSDDPFTEMRALLESKSTMGMLMERLKGSVTSSDPEQTARYFNQVVKHRNELVHHFFQLPIGRLDDEASCRDALRHLKSRLEYAQPIRELVSAAARSLIQTYDESQPH